MEFFKKLKEDIEEGIEDLTTVEHAFIREIDGRQEVVLYRKQEVAGDSIIFQTSKKLDPEVVDAFNQAFEAAIVSRTGILNALIQILT